MKPLKGMLLDIDGTLLLSNEAHAQAWVDAFSESGYEISVDRVHPLVGMGGDKLLATLVPGMTDKEGIGKDIAARRKQIFLERYAPGLKPAPGGRELCLRLREAGLHLTVATSSTSEELRVLLEKAQIDDLVEEETTSDDAGEAKPAPDIVEAALGKSGLSADDVLMLGDTPYDIESAGKAGVGVIAFRCGGHPDEELRGALAIYDDPRDLLVHLNQSPVGGRLAVNAGPAVRET